MKTVKLRGFVLQAYPFGESHKIITLFTRELGKLKVIAHGVRKTKSKYGSSFELMNEVALVLTSSKQKDLYNIKEFNLLSSCHPLREDYKLIQLLYFLVEFINLFIHEETKDHKVYSFLRRTLDEGFIHKSSFYELIISFVLKTLNILGFLADLNLCSHCGNSLLQKTGDQQKDKTIYLSNRSGWIFCNKCNNSYTDQEITLGTYRFLVSLLELDTRQISRLKIQGFIRRECDNSIEKLIVSILGKKLNSLTWMSPGF